MYASKIPPEVLKRQVEKLEYKWNRFDSAWSKRREERINAENKNKDKN